MWHEAEAELLGGWRPGAPISRFRDKRQALRSRIAASFAHADCRGRLYPFVYSILIMQVDFVGFV